MIDKLNICAQFFSALVPLSLGVVIAAYSFLSFFPSSNRDKYCRRLLLVSTLSLVIFFMLSIFQAFLPAPLANPSVHITYLIGLLSLSYLFASCFSPDSPQISLTKKRIWIAFVVSIIYIWAPYPSLAEKFGYLFPTFAVLIALPQIYRSHQASHTKYTQLAMVLMILNLMLSVPLFKSEIAPKYLLPLSTAGLYFLICFAVVRKNIDVVASRKKNRELSTENQKLRKMAEFDSLTRLLNRRTFDRIFSTTIKECEDSRLHLSFCVLDIDFFKNFNDTHGHPAGDELLKQFAWIIKNAVRENDTVVRLGGEEFGILLPEAKLEDATRLCERIRALISEFPFPQQQSDGSPLTASFGLSALNFGRNEDPSTLYKRADKALYEAKQTRNTVVAKS